MKARTQKRLTQTRLTKFEDLQEHNFVFDGESVKALTQVSQNYAIGITDNVLNAMQQIHSADPVARQYIPSTKELKTTPQELDDPIGDQEHMPVKGLVHRYPDRVLLKITHLCAVYCRFCFRREMVGPGSNDMMSEKDIVRALDYIRAHRDISEVILSGGDPFILSPRHLRFVFENLSSIPHVKIIRIHTRIPVADPKRITENILKSLPKNKAVYIAVHINHAQELTSAVRTCLKTMHKAGCYLLSQSVLLKGVNNDPSILETLYRELIALHVKPYYLHHPDFAKGTSHFRISLSEGREIVRALLGRLSGLCQPHYMLDIPGGHGKVPVTSDYLEKIGNGRYRIRDYQGGTHLYEDEAV